MIDARGKFLIPGLWDMHVHVLWDPAIGTKLQSWQFPGSVEQVAWGDNRHLVTLNANKTIYVLRLAVPP